MGNLRLKSNQIKIKMKKLLGLSIFLLAATSVNAQVLTSPKASLKLEIKQNSGTNGSGLAYNPQTQLYYAVIAGNASYPLEVFNASGNNVYTTNAGNDMRGLWYNKKAKAVQGNTYNMKGIMEMSLDENGYPSIGSKNVGNCGQPDDQSVGVFDGKKYLYYFDGKIVRIYDPKKSVVKSETVMEDLMDRSYNINRTSMIYTGVKKHEYGFLDYNAKKVYLVNKKTGVIRATVNLPSDAVTNDMFRFTYANGYVFLYDTQERAWTGYKIFE